MTVGTLARYLVGDRRAIEEIAASRWSLVVGFLLMLTGGLARNYDGAYLPAEWPVLLHGPVVSVANALILFAGIWVAARLKKGPTPPFFSGNMSFLGLFWLTTPMAWAYAVPYERFLPPAAAVEANLWTLAVVSCWRVALMVRVLSVLYRCRPTPVATFVLLFADVAVFAAARLSPAPIVDLMGGLQHSEQDAVLSSATFLITLVSMPLILVLAIAAMFGIVAFRPDWRLRVFQRAPMPVALVVISFTLLLAWVPLLAWAQPEQRLRWRADGLLRAGRVDEGLREMSEHSRSEYPPIWDPPPRQGYGEETPSIDSIRAALAEHQYAEWVRAEYLDKSWRDVGRGFVWHTSRPGAREPLVDALDSRGRDLAYRDDMQEKLRGLRFHLEHDPRLTNELRERINAAIAGARKERAALDAAEAAEKAGR